MLRFNRSFVGFFALLTWSSLTLAQGVSEDGATVNPERPSIKVPRYVREKSPRLRIKNLVNGKETEVDISSQGEEENEALPSSVVESLTAGTGKPLMPEFSLLERARGLRVFPGSQDRARPGSSMEKSLIFDQNTWRKVGFQVLRPTRDQVVIVVDPRFTGEPQTPEEAANRDQLVMKRGIRRLFQIGWQSIAKKRYDLAMNAFSALMKPERKADLGVEDLAQAHLGRGIATFHQRGCKAMLSDFRAALADTKNKDDVAYYQGLCWVESEKFENAEKVFSELVRKNHPRYAEPARFYLGVVNENMGKDDEAEAAYMDTIDFAKDKALAKLAAERLQALKQRRAFALANPWFSMAVTLAGGYDSNVIGLGQGQTAADRNVSSQGSPSLLGLFYFELTPPVSKVWAPKARFTFVSLTYTKQDLRTDYDIQLYDGALGATYALNERNSLGLDIGYSHLVKGPIGSGFAYLATPNARFNWTHQFGNADDPDSKISSLDTWMQIGLLRPKQAASAAELDLTATDLLVASRWTIYDDGRSYGPLMEIGYHPATGSENSYWSVRGAGRYNFPLGSKDSGWTSSHELSLGLTSYYQSSASRKDIPIKYTGSIAKLWLPWLENRLEGVASYNYSNDTTQRYFKAQANLLLTAFF